MRYNVVNIVLTEYIFLYSVNMNHRRYAMNTLLLSRKDIEGIIDFESAYAAARDAYKAFSSGKVVQPPIVSIEIPAHHGELDIKSGYRCFLFASGTKIYCRQGS